MKWISRYALATMGAAGTEVMVVTLAASSFSSLSEKPLGGVEWLLILLLGSIAAFTWIVGLIGDRSEYIATEAYLILASPVVVPMVYLLKEGIHAVLGYLSTALVVVQGGLVFWVGGILLGLIGTIYCQREGC